MSNNLPKRISGARFQREVLLKLEFVTGARFKTLGAYAYNDERSDYLLKENLPDELKTDLECPLDCGVRINRAYIDGSHEEDDVFLDLVHYWKLLKPGGVMFGDNTLVC